MHQINFFRIEISAGQADAKALYVIVRDINIQVFAKNLQPQKTNMYNMFI